jgi:hypothetical protein
MPTYSYDRFLLNGFFTDRLEEADGTVVYDQTGDYSPVSRVEVTKTWTNTPNYWVLRKEHRTRDLPMNDFSYYKRTTNWPYGSVDVLTFSDSGIFLQKEMVDGYYAAIVDSPRAYVGDFGTPPVPYIDVADVDRRAKLKVTLAIKDQKVNLMQAFAERRQTARLLASTVTKLTKMVTSLKRGDLRGAGKALGVNVRPRRVRKYKSVFSNNPSEAFASGVLELQYGWRPLYSDIRFC